MVVTLLGHHYNVGEKSTVIQLCVCVFSSHSFRTSTSLDVPAGVTQEEGHTGFLIHLLSAVRALIFLLSLVDCEVEFCVLTICTLTYFKKNLNASRPSEHPPVRRKLFFFEEKSERV